MPRPKKSAADSEPKKRSRTGCWPCKARKVKCDEGKPICANCQKHGETCDYSIRLNWGGRSKSSTSTEAGTFTFVATPDSSQTPKHTKSQSNGGGGQHVFSAQHIATSASRPSSSHPTNAPTSEPVSRSERANVDPQLQLGRQLLSDYQEPAVPYFTQSYGLPQNTSQHNPSQDERVSGAAPAGSDGFHWSAQHRAKRAKLNSPSISQAATALVTAPYPGYGEQSPASHYTPHSISSVVNTPATPGSSINSTSPHPSQPATLNVQDPPDLRRLSVKSLLSDPTDDMDRRPRFARRESSGYRTYGYDHGLPDHDVPHNDDRNVVLPRSPDMRRTSAAVSEVSTSSGEAEAKHIAFEPGGYYAQPVAVRLPRALEPLPEELLSNPMNLLYFHHFLNHTGRVMVPHDCPENPFRVVLPLMAVRNTQLLHLLLAFSASHRARLLGHDEPANRIAGWMSDVLPALRQALNEPGSPGVPDPNDPSSLAPLAAAIMFASLEIITPHTFSIRIPWQQHLQMARRLIIAKGGLHHLAQQADGARDKAIFFLSRWFAYLDVLGSLSNRHEQPLFGAYLEDGGGLWLVNRDNEEIYQIDCFFGFSGRCIALLAQVAELAAQCDNQRIDPVTNQVKTSWRPTAEIRQQAEELKQRLDASAGMVFRGCMHTSPGSPESVQEQDDTDAAEIYATNEAYHWAGRIHLARRVLALQSSDPEVQDCVQNVLDLLQKVRRGSSAESCLLFPMFTAGCEAQQDDQRAIFMSRMEAVEGWGISHVGHARRLMQTVWDTGKSWETLVDGEFLG
ncbi:Putative zn(2)-C6 fungal-type DNA-binding domain, fungal transcription factor [Septoria linicola]|uniref:Zn(2)-C6 fungal-type DNA-binding domain, fungal transcription factor n=1 Tax=Septoria linicola TaxID=215465 RepID=A0A9Q9EPV8_9PEZI|nr:Putative zn(2)-C6 fungal-type DNA-binding domain, fungal transcription factor [Septoria linicola]